MDDPILVMVLLLLLLLLMLEQVLLVLLDLLLDLLEVAEARQRVKDLGQTAGWSFIGHFFRGLTPPPRRRIRGEFGTGRRSSNVARGGLWGKHLLTSDARE